MEIDSIVTELRQSYESGKTRPIAWRKEQLRKLYHLIVVCFDSIERRIGVSLTYLFQG